MLTNSDTVATDNPTDVKDQLARILASSGFTRSGRMQQFLTFIVMNALEGQRDSLKEASIGTAVFDRSPDYDPKLDPIVRVEARRLRSKLESYYQNEGHGDGIIIRLPKGGYSPIFEEVPAPLQPSVLSNTIDPGPAKIESVCSPQDILPLEDSLSADALPASSGSYPTTEEALENTPSRIRPARGAHINGRRSLVGKLLVCLVVLVASVAGLTYYHLERSPRSYEVVPLTSFLGQELDPAISPDGQHLAFVWNGNDNNYDIYIKDIKKGDVTRLTRSPAHDLRPAWSPDGRDIAFLRMSQDSSEVMVIPALGGVERSVGKIRNSVNIWKADASQIYQSLGPAWSRDGRSLILTDAPGDGRSNGLYLWPLGYEQRRRLTTTPLGADDFDPSVSPDGKRIAFIRQTSNSCNDIFLLSLRSGRIHQVTFDNRSIRGVTWSSDSSSILFSSNRNGVYNLWRIPASGGSPLPITTNVAEATDPSIADNGIIVFTYTVQNSNIWRYDLKAKAEKPGASPLISSSRHNNSPQYSPDGSKIVFVSNRSGYWEIWTCDSDGANLRQLTSFRGPMLGTPHWSPDGKWIAFDARPQGHSAIYLIEYKTGAQQLFDNNTFEERMPNWSHDGQWLYFNSSRGGKIQLWKRHLADGKLYPLTQRPAYDSFESPDGRWVYFLSDGPGIWKVSKNGGSESVVPGLDTVNSSRYLAIVDTGLYFVANEMTPSVIQRYDLRTHHLQQVATIDQPLIDNTPGLSISPDEHWMLYARTDGNNSDIVSLQPKSIDRNFIKAIW